MGASFASSSSVQQAALTNATEGEVLVVWKPDHLARSLPHLIDIVAGLDRCGIGFRSLTESIDTTTAGGRLTFHILFSAPLRSSIATSTASGG
jgi:DNA invertase Pin-like site-specific DNA recombinase